MPHQPKPSTATIAVATLVLFMSLWVAFLSMFRRHVHRWSNPIASLDSDRGK